MLDALLLKTRSYRTFGTETINMDILKSFVETTRKGGSARNSQPMRFTLISSYDMCKKIFPYTSWAGALPWNPSPEEGPRAYILISTVKDYALPPITLGVDIGIAAQNILLKASELSFGGCMIGAFNKVEVANLLNLDQEKYVPQLLIALGKPTDKVVLVEATGESLMFHRDIENFINYVPKLSLDTLILAKY